MQNSDNNSHFTYPTYIINNTTSPNQDYNSYASIPKPQNYTLNYTQNHHPHQISHNLPQQHQNHSTPNIPIFLDSQLHIIEKPKETNFPFSNHSYSTQLTPYSPFQMQAQVPMYTNSQCVTNRKQISNSNSSIITDSTPMYDFSSRNSKSEGVIDKYSFKKNLKKQNWSSASNSKVLKSSSQQIKSNRNHYSTMAPNDDANTSHNSVIPTTSQSLSCIPFKNNVTSSSTKPISDINLKIINTPSIDNQKKLSPSIHKSDASLDIMTDFTKEDIIIIKNLLCYAEIHKWKYISNKVSKFRSKKLNAEYCINKFHSMYGLPFNPKNSPLHATYCLKQYKEKEIQEENIEGMLGSSIPYILSNNGCSSFDP